MPTTSTHITMKTTPTITVRKISLSKAFLSVGCLLGLFSLAEKARAQESLAQPVDQGLAVAIIDDQTGVELAEKHGIKALETGDLDGLINATTQGKTEVRLLHIAVDEDASDNPVARMTFRPFAGEQPPVAPGANLPVQQLAQKKKEYLAKRAKWQQAIIGYRAQITGEVEGFVRQVTVTQLAVSERFDKILAERNGRDFNRSDIATSIEIANKLLKDVARPVLVLNTDGVDLPGKRKPQTSPLGIEQLDPRVILIFVNTSRLPQQGVLFRGLRNEIKHADSMQQALGMVASMLEQSKDETKPVTP
jgi:hypothetical protein